MGGTNQITEPGSAVERGVYQIIFMAVEAGASDIHIEPYDRLVVVRFRIDGNLLIHTKLPKNTIGPLARYFKKQAELDGRRHKLPQHGEYSTRIKDQLIKLEVSLIPVLDGEKITLRLSGGAPINIDLESLGLEQDSLLDVEHALTEPNGFIFVCGQQVEFTSKTILSMIQVFSGSRLKVAVISDRPLSLPKFVRSCVIRQDLGFSAERYLKVLKNENYNVIGLTMLMDKKAASAAERVVNNGGLVIAGIPASGSDGGKLFASRLLNNPADIPKLRLIIGQKFVRGLCSNCRERYELTASDKSLIGQYLKPGENSSLYRLNLLGCEVCSFTGYGYTVGLFEVLTPRENKPKINIKLDAYNKAKQGLIDAYTLFNILKS